MSVKICIMLCFLCYYTVAPVYQFNEQQMTVLFGIFDRAGKGRISYEQLSQYQLNPLEQGTSVDYEQFKVLVRNLDLTSQQTLSDLLSSSEYAQHPRNIASRGFTSNRPSPAQMHGFTTSSRNIDLNRSETYVSTGTSLPRTIDDTAISSPSSPPPEEDYDYSTLRERNFAILTSTLDNDDTGLDHSALPENIGADLTLGLPSPSSQSVQDLRNMSRQRSLPPSFDFNPEDLTLASSSTSNPSLSKIDSKRFKKSD